jgi:hypothetical protein
MSLQKQVNCVMIREENTTKVFTRREILLLGILSTQLTTSTQNTMSFLEKPPLSRNEIFRQRGAEQRYTLISSSILDGYTFYHKKNGNRYEQDVILGSQELIEDKTGLEEYGIRYIVEIKYFDHKIKEQVTLRATADLITGDTAELILSAEGVIGNIAPSAHKFAQIIQEKTKNQETGKSKSVLLFGDFHSQQSGFKTVENNELFNPPKSKHYETMVDYAELYEMLIIGLKRQGGITGKITTVAGGSLGSWAIELLGKKETFKHVKEVVLVDPADRGLVQGQDPKGALFTRSTLQVALDFNTSNSGENPIAKPLVELWGRQGVRDGKSSVTALKAIGSLYMPSRLRVEKELLNDSVENALTGGPLQFFPRFILAAPVISAMKKTLHEENLNYTGTMKVYYSTKTLINSARGVLGESLWNLIKKQLRTAKTEIEKKELLEQMKDLLTQKYTQLFPKAESITVKLTDSLNHTELTTLAALKEDFDKLLY